MWSILVASVLSLIPTMRNPPPPGTYTFAPVKDLSVQVVRPNVAIVQWSSNERATVRFDAEQGFVIDEPLASRLRQRGVVVTNVDFANETLSVHFDGRMRFHVEFRRST